MKLKGLLIIYTVVPAWAIAQNIGIGTTSPQAMLHVKDSSVLFSGATVLPMMPGSPPSSGQGIRMMWYPDKAAFRTGIVTGNHWDNENIGAGSFASGYNAKATGTFSTAMGSFVTASGIESIALGSNTVANDDFATAMGRSTSASGFCATALGFNTSALGQKSVAMGHYTSARGYNAVAMGIFTLANGFSSLVVGEFNDTIVAPQALTTSTTPLFIIGNGISAISPSNAMVVRKDGHVGLGTNTPANILDINGGLAVGSSYSGTNTAPANGAIIQGNTGIGTSFVINTLDIEGRMAVGNSYSGTYPAPVNGAIIQGNMGIGTPFVVNTLDIEGRMAVGLNYSGAALAPINGAIIQGNVGIGTAAVVNTLDVEGGMAVGASYSGSQGAPSQGLIIQGNTGIGTPNPFNRLDVEGGMAVGVSYSGSIAAPVNGMIIQGNVGIGTSSPDRKLHVRTGGSGATANSSAIGVFESGSNSYVTVLCSSEDESGILFSLPEHDAHGGIVYNNSASPEGLQLRTNGNITRMTITGAGNVGIKTLTPSELLHVGTTTGDGIQIGSFEVLRDAGSTSLSINASFLPSADNSYDLGSASNRWDDVWATNGVIQTSDARDKKEISGLENGLEAIMQLKPVRYKWNNGLNHDLQIGLIAQDVQAVIPEAVRSTNIVKDEDGTVSEVNTERLGLNYATVTPVLIKAVQEQQDLIKQQQKMLDHQAVMIQNLLLRVDKLENNNSPISD